MTIDWRPALAGLLLALAGCGSQPTGEPGMADLDIVARNADHALVQLRPGQDIEDLARIF